MANLVTTNQKLAKQLDEFMTQLGQTVDNFSKISGDITDTRAQVLELTKQAKDGVERDAQLFAMMGKIRTEIDERLTRMESDFKRQLQLRERKWQSDLLALKTKCVVLEASNAELKERVQQLESDAVGHSDDEDLPELVQAMSSANVPIVVDAATVRVIPTSEIMRYHGGDEPSTSVWRHRKSAAAAAGAPESIVDLTDESFLPLVSSNPRALIAIDSPK